MVQKVLSQINKIAGVRGSVVLAEDGLVVASDLSGREDPQILGAVVSSTVNAVSNMLAKLDRGNFGGYILSGDDGHAVIWTVGQAAHVLVLLREDVNMGLVLVELRQAVRKLEEEIHL